MPQKSQLRIGIDARFYGPRQKGLGRYIQKLIENLERAVDNNVIASGAKQSRGKPDGIATSPSAPRNDKYEFVIFLRKENWPEYQPTNPNFKKVLADYRWYTLKEQILMPFKIWQAKVDLMHFPHFNLPIFYFKPFVVTIHDLVLRRFSTRRASTLGPFLYWIKNLIYRMVIWLVIKRAEKIIAVSGYTKKDILKCFRVEPEKIEVIYEGSSVIASSARGGAKQSRGKPDGIATSSSTPRNDILQKHNITKPYLLYVGNAYPHKNLERLILAFGKLVNEHQLDLQLVLVGGMDYFYQRLKELSSAALSERIIFTDFLSDNDLNILYQNASLYVFPSLCEGFGLPPLEAMAFDLPVVSSSATCLPEILGQAAIYFNPENIEEMAEKIEQVLKEKKLQERLIREGWKKIKEYNWLETAQKTLGIYQAILRK